MAQLPHRAVRPQEPKAPMKRADAYLAPPGCCAVCRTSASRQLIVDMEIYDPNITVRQSRIYLCGVCVMEAARLVATDSGLAIVDAGIADSYKATLAELEAAEAKVAEHETKATELRELLGISEGVTS